MPYRGAYPKLARIEPPSILTRVLRWLFVRRIRRAWVLRGKTWLERFMRCVRCRKRIKRCPGIALDKNGRSERGEFQGWRWDFNHTHEPDGIVCWDCSDRPRPVTTLGKFGPRIHCDDPELKPLTPAQIAADDAERAERITTQWRRARSGLKAPSSRT